MTGPLSTPSGSGERVLMGIGYDPMRLREVRNLAFVALAIALTHIVFGAFVRISGSGMGCGDHWPKCYGYWFPPLQRVDLIIEVTHRYLAVVLFIAIAAMALRAWRLRHVRGIGGRGGAARPAYLAVALWFAPALFGAVTVRFANAPWATVIHKLLAASLLAVLSLAVVRSAGFGGARAFYAAREHPATDKAWRAILAAAGLALLVILMGGLTAKIPDAAVACRGFPLCGDGSLGGGAQHVQLTHRVLAYLLVLHLIGLPFAFRKRNEPPVLQRGAWILGGLGVWQLLVAAAMVLGEFPLNHGTRSLHQATGIAIWMAAITTLWLTRIATGRAASVDLVGHKLAARLGGDVDARSVEGDR
jgi:heme a synthase